MEEYTIPLPVGEKLVREARRVVETYLKTLQRVEPEIPAGVNKKMGVFVTIERFPGGELRGCIGFPRPVYVLSRGLAEAAISAATRDPRFLPLKQEELDNVVFEVSVLTPPERIKYRGVDELKSSVEIGRHGLIAKKGFFEGLLLPQVPVEYGWDVEEFLSHTCVKAGMHPEEWKDGSVTFYRFSGEIFCEVEPRGRVVRKVLKDEGN